MVAVPIKSIQRGTVVLTPSGGASTATITSVDMNKSFCVNNGAYNQDSAGRPPTSRAQLTAATTVTVYSGCTTPTDNINVAFTVVEYY